MSDLSIALQAKLLRFLQERVIERIGGREEIPVDVRIVCASHQNLQTLIESNHFRKDLYYRLSEIVLTIPPYGTDWVMPHCWHITLKISLVPRKNYPR